MKYIYIQTFGCQMNVHDSQNMLSLLEKTHALKCVERAENADILLINTCSIREKAQEKLFHQLGRYKILKKKNPNLIIGVGGCVASQEGSDILKRAPYVDLIFGPQTIHRLPAMLDAFLDKRKSQIDISFPEIEKFDHMPIKKENEYSAYLSIMEGCSKYCSFCVVPYTRGEEINRPLNDVLEEAHVLVDQGVKEITLLGQNVNAYKFLDQGEWVDFTFLLECLADIEGIERIRFTTSHPVEFSDRLVEAFERIPKLASFLHLPVQSGSDKILAQMKRQYTILEYEDIIGKLHKARSGMQISSDFIVGFPNESDQDFQNTMDLVARMNFDKSYSFIYSPRPGTPASFLEDKTPVEEKVKRLSILQKHLHLNAQKFTRAMLNSRQRVLIEGVEEKTGLFYGRADNTRKIFVTQGNPKLGELYVVHIQQVEQTRVEGKVVHKI